jgi:dipeptide/tripeptide permease
LKAHVTFDVTFVVWKIYCCTVVQLLGCDKLYVRLNFLSRFLDKAAIVPPATSDKKGHWRLCTVSQVEEVKKLLCLCPVWASMVVFFMATAQMSSTLIEQGTAMDNRVGPFTVPPASMASFDVLVLIPVYDVVLVPPVVELDQTQSGCTT